VGWLIDTSIWIAVERGRFGAADMHAITRQEKDFEDIPRLKMVAMRLP